MCFQGEEGCDNVGRMIEAVLEAQGKVVLGNLKTQEIQKAKGMPLTLVRQGPGDEGG